MYQLLLSIALLLTLAQSVQATDLVDMAAAQLQSEDVVIQNTADNNPLPTEPPKPKLLTRAEQLAIISSRQKAMDAEYKAIKDKPNIFPHFAKGKRVPHPMARQRLWINYHPVTWQRLREDSQLAGIFLGMGFSVAGGIK